MGFAEKFQIPGDWTNMCVYLLWFELQRQRPFNSKMTKYILLISLLFVGLTLCAQTNDCNDCWVRTELYFGLSKPSGGKVKRSQWKQFVNRNITPAFPEGSSIIDASGQWMDTSNQKTIAERSKILIVVYPLAVADEKDRLLEKISKIYIDLYDQETVMRVDTIVEVRFYHKG